MMERDEFVKAIQELGAKFAEWFGCDVMSIGEDRQKGIWGETMTRFLEEKHGACTEEIKWTKENEQEGYQTEVEFRFRFANPCLSIRVNTPQKEVLGSLEFSNWNKETQNHDGEYKLSEVLSFGGREGMELATEMADAYEKMIEQKESQAVRDDIISCFIKEPEEEIERD